MVKAADTVVVEVAGSQGECLYFAPLQRKIRGRFDFHKPREPNARRMIDVFPDPIPGQRVEVDLATGATAILEPLRHENHTVLREKLRERYRCDFAPSREEVGKLHLPTALFWLKRAVEGGHAEVISGELPDDIGGTPQKRFLSRPTESPTDKLAAAIEKQTEAIMSLLKHIAKQNPQPSRN